MESTAAKAELVKFTNPELADLTTQALAVWQELGGLVKQGEEAWAAYVRESSEEDFHKRVPHYREARELADALWKEEWRRREPFFTEKDRIKALCEDHALVLGRILVKVKKALSTTSNTFIEWREATFGPDPEQKIANRCDYCVKKARKVDAVDRAGRARKAVVEDKKARKEATALEAIKKQRAVRQKAEDMRQLADEVKSAEAIARAERLEKRLKNASADVDHRLRMVEELHRDVVKEELDKYCAGIYEKMRDLCRSVLSGESERKSVEKKIVDSPSTYGFGIIGEHNSFKKRGPSPSDVRAMMQLRFDFAAQGCAIKQDIDALVEKVEAASHRKPFGVGL